MTKLKMMERLAEFIDDYGDIFITETEDVSLYVKDGEGNKFKISIEKE